MNHNGNANPLRPPGGDFGHSLRPLLLATAAVLAGYLMRKLAGRPGAVQLKSEPRPIARDLRTGHEVRDASAGWIFGLVMVLLASGLAIHLLLAGMLHLLRKGPPPADVWRPRPRTAAEVSAPAPKYPKLQVSPPLDLQALRAREDARLNSYGWLNRTSGTVHIPIGLAIDKLLQKGLPVRKQNGTEERGPSSYELQLQRVERGPNGTEQAP